ncbi:MAG: YybH family protein [Gemmatimonadaceae bacterium]|jgi:ketosteroid isomerase-like protein
MRRTRNVFPLALVTLIAAGCGRNAAPVGDSTVASSRTASFDETAARAQILGADSAFVRAIKAKYVDSVMVYYDPHAVSLGTKAVKDTAELRKSYNEAVKNPPRDVNFQSGGVNFSNDHSMAWDYGTVSQTADVKGKPVKTSGTYLNVWKNVGGRWMIVAEISSTAP